LKRLTLAELAGRACLDLRPSSEYFRGHLPGAVNIPLEELARRLHELPPRGEELLLFGPRAEEAARFLAKRPRWELALCEEPLPPEGLSFDAEAPLWKPNPWLAEHWQRIPRGGCVMDVAMGTGRDAVFLAMRGFRVEGEDILPEAVAKARDLAERHGVSIDARVADLTRSDPLPQAAFDGILVFNYLDRSLFPDLQRALAPGGVLLCETFLRGQEKLGSPKRPEHLLEANELRAAFEGLQILEYREGLSSPRRSTASLLARRSGKS